jgi:RNA recognition motif-containing protein
MKGRYAFVEFQTEKDADNAIKETNGIKLQGCEILVQQTSNYFIFNF